MASTRRKKRYKFKPNKNFYLLLLILILLIWLLCKLCSCGKKEEVVETAPVVAETEEPAPVRDCVRPDGTPSADYFEVYPPSVGDKVIYLTFDDGPSKKVTPQVLDILKQYNVKATFFVIGENAEKNPDLIKRIVEEGHSVASHTYSHDYDAVYADTESFREELHKSREALANIVGEENVTDIFRFPGGAFREQRAEFKEVLVEENIPFVNWNCLTGDAETKNPVPANLIEKAKKSAANSGAESLTMLMHDAGAKQATADALPGLIEYFQSEGYRFDALRRY